MGKLYPCWALLVMFCTTGIMATSPLDKRAIALDYMREIDRERMECNFGQFYSYESETCHSCDRSCENRTDLLTSCGFECQSFFMISNLTGELQEQRLQMQRESADLQMEKEELQGKNTRLLIPLIVFALTTLASAVIISILCYLLRKSKKDYITPLPPTADDEGGQRQNTWTTFSH